MDFYRHFQRMLLRNYLIGSLIAVIGVGGFFVFSTLHFSTFEKWMISGILALSFFIMCFIEYRAFSRHIKPIYRAFYKSNPSIRTLTNGFVQAHRFPLLTVKRIMGPHFLGLSVPAIILVTAAIYFGFLNMPYMYLFMGGLGAVIVAGMHAIVEFYLTTSAVKPIIEELRNRAVELHGDSLSQNNRVFVSIQRKIQLSTIFIGTFPVLLFALANQVKLYEQAASITRSYWSWAIFILLLGMLFAFFGTYLIYKDLLAPMKNLQTAMEEVQLGNSQFLLDNTYSDEFSRLVSGFNHMSSSIRDREEMNHQLLDSFFAVMAATMDARDPYTAGHSQRVAEYSVQIGEKAGLSMDELSTLKKAALLHDIGKIGIPDHILLKDGKLDDIEFSYIKKHPVVGFSILSQVQPKEAMEPLLPGVKYHHERYDGKGYPEGLSGDDIPFFGRIIAVADAYDAMTSDRPYRKGMSRDKAVAILLDGKGTQWDPALVPLLVEELKLSSVS
ncbi:HD domain-containing protein [Fictibacillus sp. B-59209]|uniref:HD domain-containing phosphohydrolase n=1 Tax=Fictibacillus sp. B-59209 TaxID=3024873 RepID=UPI002E21CBB9|nr:HD domain-containing protein [Fictibacillus sp. B-59209]